MSKYLALIKAIRCNDYEIRTKLCEFCKIQFCDITKRNHRKTCSDDCDNRLMVYKRKKAKNYTQTLEQKRKKSISVKATYSSRDVFSPELRQKFSETMKKNWAEGKIDTSNHWMKTLKGKNYMSSLLKGRTMSIESRKLMSLAAQIRVRNKRNTLYTSARGGYRHDLKQYFRSSWEANFARILNYCEKKWLYEYRTFQLSETMSYTPDFLCDTVFYEIKGRMDKISQLKLDLMRSLYSSVEIVIIDSVKYKELKLQYKNLILGWEN